VRWLRVVELILICICSLETSAHAAPLDVKQWSGRVVYLDFWASWCAPCRRSFPWMQKMPRAYESQGFTIIAINVDQSHADASHTWDFCRSMSKGTSSSCGNCWPNN
jgi:thiol-disulfide isomerase/thioredoxin